MQKGRLLIIDDEERLRNLLARILQLEGYEVTMAANGKEGLRKLQHDSFQVVLSDVKLPDSNGIELTQQIKTNWPSTEVIVLTAFGTINDGVKAIKSGAFDYIMKGDDNEKIIPLVSKAMDKALLQQRVQELENKLNDKFGFDRIIGRSAAITEVVKLAQKVALTDTTVLLLGETGTGKEIFAEAIHQASNRSTKSFVAVNCSAFTKELLESELFGHKAGSFTGATKDKKGLFEEASGGTIFLDEIGELDHELQAKLLRVLESQQFIKIGDTKPTHVNVRILAATNRDLQRESEENHFRSDLRRRTANDRHWPGADVPPETLGAGRTFHGIGPSYRPADIPHLKTAERIPGSIHPGRRTEFDRCSSVRRPRCCPRNRFHCARGLGS